MTTLEPRFPGLLPELFRDDVLRIETRRMWLRWPVAADEPALSDITAVAACAHPGARWPLGWEGGVASVADLIDKMRTANETGQGLFLALTEKGQPGMPIGLVGLDMRPVGAPSLGFLLDVRRQGFGLMSEAVRAVAGAALRFANIEHVRGDATMYGIGARRVLEKSGFRAAATAGGAEPRCDVFVIRREVRPGSPLTGFVPAPSGEKRPAHAA